MKNYRRGNGVLIIIIIVAVLMVGGLIYYSKNKPESIQVSTTSTDSTPTTQVADWKMYTDSENGFSFKYPKEFTPDVNNNYPANGDIMVTLRRPSYGDWSFSVSGDYNHEKFNDAVKNYPLKDQQKTITVAGRNSHEFSYDTGNVPSKTVYIPIDNGEYIAINWKSIEAVSKDKSIKNDESEFYTLLSTFKLTK